MIKMEQSITINRTQEDVFAFIVSPENETQWQADLVDSRFTSQGDIGMGSTGRDLRRFMGKEIETTWVVTDYQPSHKIGFRVVKGPIPFDATYIFESVKGGTKLSFAAWAETKGVSKLFDPLVNRMGQKQYERDLAALKAVLEAES
ncbi:MAG: SRPBCC family protein [Anaerolineaceae bacterium]|nr:SRPBCC family protein [Anaerolineaceae bacterium]